MVFNWGNRPNIPEAFPYLKEEKVQNSAKDSGECSKRRILWERELEVFDGLFVSGAMSTAPASIGTF